jgi:hypothetical protein
LNISDTGKKAQDHLNDRYGISITGSRGFRKMSQGWFQEITERFAFKRAMQVGYLKLPLSSPKGVFGLLGVSLFVGSV